MDDDKKDDEYETTEENETVNGVKMKGVARPRDEIWNVGAHINVAAISELVEVRATVEAATIAKKESDASA